MNPTELPGILWITSNILGKYWEINKTSNKFFTTEYQLSNILLFISLAKTENNALIINFV